MNLIPWGHPFLINARLHLNSIKKLNFVVSDQINISRFVRFRSTQSKTCILKIIAEMEDDSVTRIEEERFATRFAKMRTACYWIFKHDQSFMILFKSTESVSSSLHKRSRSSGRKLWSGEGLALWLQRSSTHWVEIKRNSHSFLSVQKIYKSFSFLFFYYYCRKLFIWASIKPVGPPLFLSLQAESCWKLKQVNNR